MAGDAGPAQHLDRRGSHVTPKYGQTQILIHIHANIKTEQFLP